MNIDKIQTYITPKTTGYTAAAGLGVTVISGITKNKSVRKMHKPFAFITALFTLVHIGLIEYYTIYSVPFEKLW